MVIHRPTRDTRGCRDIFQGDRGEAAGCEGLARRRQHGPSRPGGVLGRSACHKTFLYGHGVCILAFTNTLYVRRVAMSATFYPVLMSQDVATTSQTSTGALGLEITFEGECYVRLRLGRRDLAIMHSAHRT